MKIRRNHRQKRYRYNVNRKTLNKTRSSTGKIKDPVLKKLWEETKKPGTNFREMGLAVNPNKSVPIPNFKSDRLKMTKIVNGFVEEEITDEDIKQTPKRGHVVHDLEEMAKQKADSKLRLPKGVVSHLTYFLDKYQFNYKAMVTDRRNHDQWTWKQFRMKIKQFMSIPEQFNMYLEKKKLPLDKKLDWPEYDSDSEWK
ncbi:nucleolar protein 16 [Haematobia irritans]|uniref:nucleolar protein 16 n=1 Tax=Haematobia irritans TaxID=7368 RepID=UPI003F50BAF0